MDVRDRIAQIYGYAVCLVAVITVLVGLGAFISAVFDLRDPMHSTSFHDGPSLASYDIYKVEVQAMLKENQEVPDETTLQAMFEAAKDNRIQTVSFGARRTITINTVLIVVCLGLLVTHLRWLQRLRVTPQASLAPREPARAA